MICLRRGSRREMWMGKLIHRLGCRAQSVESSEMELFVTRVKAICCFDAALPRLELRDSASKGFEDHFPALRDGTTSRECINGSKPNYPSSFQPWGQNFFKQTANDSYIISRMMKLGGAKPELLR